MNLWLAQLMSSDNNNNDNNTSGTLEDTVACIEQVSIFVLQMQLFDKSHQDVQYKT